MPRVSGRVRVLTLLLGCAVIVVGRTSAALAVGSGPATAPAAADLSTPFKAAQALDAAIRAGDASAIRAATTDATEGDYRALESYSAFIRSTENLRDAAVAKFGAGARSAALNIPTGKGAWDTEAAVETKIDGDTAVLLARANRQPIQKLKKRDGLWRVDLGQSMGRTQLAEHAAQWRAVAKVMDRTAGEITDGQYASASDASAALRSAMQPVTSPASGDLTLARGTPSKVSAVESPPKSPVPGYNPKIVDAHCEKYPSSSIPMTVELVLKLLGRMPADSYAIQQTWKDKRDGNFSDFDGKTFAGVTFHHKFDQPRGNEFPTEDLFDTIDAELDHGRYVIISLYTGRNYALYVIVGRTADGDYHAVDKIGEQTFTVTNVKPRIREMKGTDILTYTIGASKDVAR
ncbi:MAG TPA: hypothetical protein VGI81_07665 [Tepidisphaeraceae bacterium]|jgi:hypothetical protein